MVPIVAATIGTIVRLSAATIGTIVRHSVLAAFEISVLVIADIGKPDEDSYAQREHKEEDRIEVR